MNLLAAILLMALLQYPPPPGSSSAPMLYHPNGGVLMIVQETGPGPQPSAFVDFVAPDLSYQRVEVPYSHTTPSGASWWEVDWRPPCGEAIYFQITIAQSVYGIDPIKDTVYCVFAPAVRKR